MRLISVASFLALIGLHSGYAQAHAGGLHSPDWRVSPPRERFDFMQALPFEAVRELAGTGWIAEATSRARPSCSTAGALNAGRLAEAFRAQMRIAIQRERSRLEISIAPETDQEAFTATASARSIRFAYSASFTTTRGARLQATLSDSKCVRIYPTRAGGYCEQSETRPFAEYLFESVNSPDSSIALTPPRAEDRFDSEGTWVGTLCAFRYDRWPEISITNIETNVNLALISPTVLSTDRKLHLSIVPSVR